MMCPSTTDGRRLACRSNADLPRGRAREAGHEHQHAVELAGLVEEVVRAQLEGAGTVLRERVVREHGHLAAHLAHPGPPRFQYTETVALLQLQVEEHEVP